MAPFRLDANQSPINKVRRLNSEALTKEGLVIASTAAVRKAKEKAINVLPLPSIAHRYNFVLKTTDGTAINSNQLHREVVLIDCWATWCGPCVKMMPDLQKLYEVWHPKALEIIGLSWDEDAGAAKAALQARGIAWPLVIVPNSKEARQLWSEASRISNLPRTLLIDQEGMLRLDSSKPEEVARQVAMLLGKGRSGER